MRVTTEVAMVSMQKCWKGTRLAKQLGHRLRNSWTRELPTFVIVDFCAEQNFICLTLWQQSHLLQDITTTSASFSSLMLCSNCLEVMFDKS